ncbi:unnamed protein product [Albugo candida]|uniref:Uncharacterized protein n=1 Tax=Albugo candida TaxID=65357 RepID=A0A024GUZ2_9STRA|nr:unnamed protein product [Albugo candida]|eukprot:CCI50411.1 unnamed protein product [Albugo candida]
MKLQHLYKQIYVNLDPISVKRKSIHVPSFLSKKPVFSHSDAFMKLCWEEGNSDSKDGVERTQLQYRRREHFCQYLVVFFGRE